MDNPNIDNVTQDEVAKAEVASELEEAKSFAKTLNIEDVKSGQWFITLLQKVVQSYNRNARAEYFQQKYPGLPPDEIADILTSVTVKYATIAGAITGAAVTVNQIGALSSAGMTIAVMAGAIGAEMVYLARIQMRLVLDLSVVYDLQPDPDDPEDVLMIFGYAMGVAPVGMLGKGLQKAAQGGTQRAIKKYVSKGTLKALQDFGKRIGIRILQKSVLKYTVPIVSAAVGSSYNYVTTKSVGGIAKNHLKNRGKVTEELRQLVSRQNTYDLAFPAAAMYMAQIDGEFSAKEKEFYRAILSRMSFEEHTQAELKKLMADEGNIIQAIAQIEDVEIRSSLVEVLVLMAVYDGELVEEERDFLIKAAAELNVPLDINDVERRTGDYRVVIEKNVFQKAAGSTKESASKAAGIAGQAASNVKGLPQQPVVRFQGLLVMFFDGRKMKHQIQERMLLLLFVSTATMKLLSDTNFVLLVDKQ
ncbi:MAG: TerB family tellurite resistance protein [Chloroflexi bacterium]|nr:TerB family tellurite resistance protein [Chloroflexota bacterium]